MKQQDDRNKTSKLTWVIRVIIIVIFCVSVVIGAVKLAEAHQKKQHNEQLEESIQQGETST